MNQVRGNIIRGVGNVLIVMVRQRYERNRLGTASCRSLAVAYALLVSLSVHAQSINIDIDVFFGPPQLGNGAPSSAFGGAAEQTGFWNRIPSVNGGPPIPLTGLDGVHVGATMKYETTSPSGMSGVNFPGNSGDFALLLNDAKQVAAVVEGGASTYTFNNFASGAYDVFTYAVRPGGQYLETPVFVPEASHLHIQVVTGPMPGNSLEYLVTHSIHRIILQSNTEFHVTITQPPNNPLGMYVNGFQIKAVPEPTFALATGVVTFYLLRFRKSHKKS